jgi:ATP-dependent DNA helicase RecG
LTGSTPPAEKEAVYQALADGSIDVVIGTHALIQEAVEFQRLALAIIDEQHRFGVAQRAALRQKGYNPHVLVMTATPIPRSLALTVFGDLDLSIIDEMPPGRRPIKTRLVLPRERERAYSFVRSQIEKGRQAFIICPLVEESEKVEAKAAKEEYKRLRKQIFPDLRLGLLHGRMKADDKEDTMARFARGDLDILVSTSVVEVGIDVPNASVMLVEGANRFGLAQLHQFRGRVGRGDHPSYCLLFADSKTETAKERLEAIESTQDGFVLAEKDLELRGPGEFFGTRQSGLPDLRLASFANVRLLERARSEAQRLFEADPELSSPELRLLVQQVNQFWSGEGDAS